MKAPAVEQKTVLVTGCSSGIGEATARVLREHGWRVLPTARKEADLVELREQGFEAIRLDLADSDSVQAAARETLALLDGQLGALVNNAGFGQPGALEDITREALRYQFEVNLFGMQELTNLFIPVMRERGYGRIVNVSSVVGKVALPFYGAYSATKFAMEALTDAMRVELRDTGVAVSLVEPGPIATRFGQNAARQVEEHLDLDSAKHASTYRQMLERRKGKSITKPFTKPPEAVAKKILHALESRHPRIRYPVTVPAYVGAFMSRFAPTGLMDGVMSLRWESRGRAKAP